MSPNLILILMFGGLTLLMVTWGWRGMFIVTGVFGILVAACWFAFYKSKARYLAELPAEAREQLLAAQAHKQAVPSARPSVQAQLAAWAELFRHKSTWGAVLGFMGVIYMLWLHLTWLPGYFEREHGLNLQAYAQAHWWTALVAFVAVPAVLSRSADGLRLAGAALSAMAAVVVASNILKRMSFPP